jgi:HEAT repeat protein
MKTCLLICLLLCCGVSHSAEELPLDYPQAGGWKDLKVPDGASASLVLPASVKIGEQIPAELVIRNLGRAVFEITTGGDYRATGFPQRMKVRVRDASGKALPELTQANYSIGGGGLMGGSTLEPGISHSIAFPLDRYVSFHEAGLYTVIVGHDLGWQRDEKKPHPIATSTIEVELPTPQQAADMVKAIIAGKQATPTHVAFQGRSYPPMREEAMDYITQAKLCVLRHPVFLPALKEAAENGSAEAVSGLGYIATAEATEVLIGLLQSRNDHVQSEALNQLRRRVFSNQDPSQPAVHSMWGGDVFQIGPLPSSVWRSEFGDALADTAARLLSHDNPNVVNAAAGIVVIFGKESAGEAVLAALQKALDRHRNIPRTETAARYPPLPEPALLDAVDGLRKRGWRSPQPGGTALMVAKFREYADKDIPKPPGEKWKDSMLTWVENGPPTLREHALKAIPQPLSPAAVKVVLKALEDDNPRVLIAACEVAQVSKLKDFIRPLCQIVEVDRVESVHGAAIQAAEACGARMELWRAVAQTIIAKELLVDSVKTLVLGTIELPLGSGSSGGNNFNRDQRFAIRAAWQEFLSQHASELSAGKRVPMPDAATTAKLTGTPFPEDGSVVGFTLKDGTLWPPRSK